MMMRMMRAERKHRDDAKREDGIRKRREKGYESWILLFTFNRYIMDVDACK